VRRVRLIKFELLTYSFAVLIAKANALPSRLRLRLIGNLKGDPDVSQRRCKECWSSGFS
jgi:hypothetical protein